MYISIILLPFLSALITGIAGRHLGKGATIFSTTLIFISFFISLFILYEVGFNHCSTLVDVGGWITGKSLSVKFNLYFDSLSSTMSVVVLCISSFVHLYSIAYMREDPHIIRFFAFLSLFTFFMEMLVLSDNFLTLLIGWEGVGIVSFLLITFWYTRVEVSKAGIQAMVMNRIGDIFLVLALGAIVTLVGSLDFGLLFTSSKGITDILDEALINDQLGNWENSKQDLYNSYWIISILIVGGIMGKSAQIGLHTWLPNAMEAPTPVSALLHAATMVTAGVYLLIRSSPLLELSEYYCNLINPTSYTALTILAAIGGLTALMASSIGLVENDIKKVIAYSTCSQLGYMVFCCGLSSYTTAFYHLTNHATFKALLFLSAGIIIYSTHDQDIRRMGGFKWSLPLTYSYFLIGSIALMGLPFLTGFFSKDHILEIAYAQFTLPASFCHWLGLLSALFTAFYSLRVITLTFLSSPNASKPIAYNLKESTFIALPLLFLVLCSIFLGYFLKDLAIGLGSDFWVNAIYELPRESASLLNLSNMELEFIPSLIKLLPLIFSITGAVLAVIINL